MLKKLFSLSFLLVFSLSLFVPLAKAKLPLNTINSIVRIINPIDEENAYFGSGVLIHPDGYVLTANHVIHPDLDQDGSPDLEPSEVTLCLTYSSSELPYCGGVGEIITSDPAYDLALLRLTHIYEPTTEDPTTEKDFNLITLEEFETKYESDSPFVFLNTLALEEGVELADEIQILGYPAIGGETITYTRGSVSGFERLHDPETNESYPFMIKTDTTINPGSSGGGSFDSSGNFLGTPILYTFESEGGNSLGFIISLPIINSFLYNYFGESYLKDFYPTSATSQPTCGENSHFELDSCVCNSGYVWESADPNDLDCVTPSEVTYELCGNNSHYQDGYCICDEGYIPENDDQKDYDCILPESSDLSPISEVEPEETVSSPTTEEEPSEESTEEENPIPTRFRADAARSPYLESILSLYRQGIIEGYPDGTFRPTQKLNRAEFLKIILEAYRLDNSCEGCKTISFQCDQAPFPDVSQDSWYAPYTCYAKSNQILAGYPDGLFHPEREINLVEALKIILNTYNLSTRPATPEEKWFLPYLEYAYENDLYLRTLFGADTLLRRDEMVELLSRIREL